MTFSRVHVTRSVFTFVFDSTELRFTATDWSTSVSSRAARPVGKMPAAVGTIWFAWGDCSRSQRTL